MRVSAEIEYSSSYYPTQYTKCMVFPTWFSAEALSMATTPLLPAAMPPPSNRSTGRRVPRTG